MRICIDMGHTPASPGASGYLDELDCDRELGKRVIAELERRGHAVYDSTPDDSVRYPEEINQRCTYANARDIDLMVSIHLNAGGGTGTEVLYYMGDSAGQAYAARISANLAAALGLLNRGAKGNDWVGVICNTNCTTILIEACFVDTYADYLAWNRTSWDAMVKAVCDGIDGGNYEEEDDMQLTDKINDVMIHDGDSYANVGNCLFYAEQNTEKIIAMLTAQSAAIEALAVANGADPNIITETVQEAVKEAMSGITFTAK